MNMEMSRQITALYERLTANFASKPLVLLYDRYLNQLSVPLIVLYLYYRKFNLF